MPLTPDCGHVAVGAAETERLGRDRGPFDHGMGAVRRGAGWGRPAGRAAVQHRKRSAAFADDEDVPRDSPDGPDDSSQTDCTHFSGAPAARLARRTREA